MAALVMLVVTGTLLSGAPVASAQANSPVTGQPTISMWPVPVTPRVTQTLRAYTTAIEDEDGMDDVSFTYQWVSNDGSTDTDIEGETGRTYVLRPSDEGKTFEVRVAFTDNGGNEESVTSEPTVEVVAEDAAICGRTPAVRKRLLRMVDVDFDRFVDCAIVTDAHLTSVTFMLLHGIPGSIPPPDFDSLRPGDLDGLTNLETLEVKGPISELPDGLFDDLTALRRLTLSRTNLTGLPEGVFDNLTGLTSLDLTQNRSLNALPDGAFDNLSNLTELDLRSSGLTQLPDDVFDSLTKLRHLELSGNPLTALPDDVFDSLTKLRHLELYGNPLTALPEGAFDNLTNLRVLKVNANLTTLPEGLLDNLTNLETLSLGGDELTALPDGLFDNLTNLEWLGLGGNELASLPGGIFDSLTNLESLVLSGNELASLPADLFQHTTSLRRLLLGGNPGAPFVFGLEVARNDDGSVVVNVSDATPFDIQLTLEAEGGALSATEVTLPAGSNSSEKIDVSPAGDGATAVRVVSAEFDATYISGIAVRRGTPLTLANANSDNHLATGAPTTTGTAQVGQTLAASTSAIADQDGLTSVTFEYQWASSDGTTDRDIEGATGSTYTLVASVVGTQVKVLVTFADDAGNHEMLTSEATANVESAPNVPATGQPVIIGKT